MADVATSKACGKKRLTLQVVQGTIAELMGPHSVTFYDLKKSTNPNASPSKVGDPIALMAGEKFNLKQRIPID